MTDLAVLKTKIDAIKGKRTVLLKLLENPNIGTLRLDVNQALEELDELIAELDQTL
ncbi:MULTISPECIES: hypothetical protein [Cyanophyceae]|uniref:hypothetical protein n=1 Tax=Cyanophyceae TaxID=3028117 RepID=UPI00016DCA41|nr:MULTISPECIES: hypothetical protein [Cyanophyceae]ACB00220.1 conserved hypothetical protein [Picosynechococcus sp. PCC 7002]SMH53010.1 hypothetical protein SAMN06272755_2563 [Picosynechococcus sp. OG1]SMQ82487.1 hypothetical protein SAMN06272774_1838 [Synechococcus sp. 7002]